MREVEYISYLYIYTVRCNYKRREIVVASYSYVATFLFYICFPTASYYNYYNVAKYSEIYSLAARAGVKKGARPRETISYS